MSLDYPICVENVGIGILEETSPAAVEFEGRLWVFYNGLGDDGIWFTRFDGIGWEHARRARPATARADSHQSYSHQAYPHSHSQSPSTIDNSLSNLSLSLSPSDQPPQPSSTSPAPGLSRPASTSFLPRHGSSPCPVVHAGRLYLFWSNRLADGILCSAWNGKRFHGIHDIGALSSRPISLGAHSSPAAISFADRLYLFWTGAANDALYFTSSPTGGPEDWLPAQSCRHFVDGVGVAPGTSPALTVFQDRLHIFYNGAGNDGTWYFTHSAPPPHTPAPPAAAAAAAGGGGGGEGDGGGDDPTAAAVAAAAETIYSPPTWSDLISIQQTVGGNGFLGKTSPVALAMADGDRLGLFWTGAGVNGVWYSLFHDGRWYKQQSVLKVVSNHALHSNTNCAAVEFLHEPYIFWAGLEGGLWFTSRRVYDVDRDHRDIFPALLADAFAEIHISLPLGHPDLAAAARDHLSLWPDHHTLEPDFFYSPPARLDNARFATAFVAALMGFRSTRTLLASGAYTFASVVYCAISRGYAVKMRLLPLNGSLKADIIAPGRDHNFPALPQKRDGEL